MTGYCVSDIAAITGGVLSGDGTAPVTGVVIDSRAVTPGALLPALPQLLQTGDCVLVKASHSMQFERVVQALTQV